MAQQQPQDSSEILIIILFLSLISIGILIAILYTDIMASAMYYLIKTDYYIATLINKIYPIFDTDILNYVAVILKHYGTNVSIKFDIMSLSYSFEGVRGNGIEIFNNIMVFFRNIHYIFATIVFILCYIILYKFTSPIVVIKSFFGRIKNKTKLIEEAKKRIKIKNNWFKVYPNDKELQKVNRIVKFDNFLALDYYPPYYNLLRNGGKMETIKTSVAESIKYTNSILNLNENYYKAILEFIINFQKEMVQRKDYNALYYITYIMSLTEDEFINKTIPIIKNKTIILEGEKILDFYKIFNKYLSKKYLLKLDNNKDKLENAYAILIQDKTEPTFLFSLNQLHTAYQLYFYKNKKTYLNNIKKDIGILNDFSYREKWSIFDKLTFLYNNKFYSKKEYESIRISLLKFKKSDEKKYIILQKDVNEKYYKFYEYVYKELIKQQINGGSSTIDYARPIIPKLYILNPLPKKSNILEQFKSFKCLGFKYIFPILEQMLVGPEEKYNKQIAELKKELNILIKDKTIKEEKEEMIETIKSLINEIENAKEDTDNVDSKASKLKKIFNTHQFEETIVLALWEYGLTFENLPTGRLSNVKFENITLWYALTSLGRPFRFVAGLPIFTVFELEKEIYLKKQPKKDRIVENPPTNEIEEISKNKNASI